MDIFIHVPRVNVDEIAAKSAPATTSAEFREQVIHARERQLARLRESWKTSNAEMSNKDIDTYCVLWEAESELLQKAVQRLELSTRAYYRTLKLARTIADLSDSDNIKSEHITEALGYREKTK